MLYQPEWHRYTSFPPRTATTLYSLEVDDLMIQQILRQTDISITRQQWKVISNHDFWRPVSFLRAFVREDWQRLCAAAGLKKDQFEILAYTPARLCVSRRKAA